MAGDMECGEEVPLRELNQQTSRVMARVAAGETVTITKDGVPIGDIVPRGGRLGRPSYPFRTDGMGPLDLPDLDGPALTDDEIDETLRGMGGTGGAADV
ncbi:type II toxin-antitoxin system Phd/YefM family antitoxin [Streptomyces alboflavus]|uniref:type II toxin-antitoxin system Phd/YefM family antitoxin n=1 Tax=Streptomyces alboflavus TaxID=67267 RepID=UPI0036A981C9